GPGLTDARLTSALALCRPPFPVEEPRCPRKLMPVHARVKNTSAGVLSVPRPVTRSCDVVCYFEGPRSVLDELPSGEPGFEVVPVADVAPLAQLPAQVDLAAPELRAESDQAAGGILHLDAKPG